MTYHGLRFEVRRFCGAPLIAAKGCVDSWQSETLQGLLQSFKWKGHEDVIVDLTGVSVVRRDGANALAFAIKQWNPEMNVHIVATGEVAYTLDAQSYPFRAHVCSSLDEAAQYICMSRKTLDYYVEKSVQSQTVMDLPLAA